jgi:hypothetical protein
LPFFPGGVMDLPDFREPREIVRERGCSGVSAGVGKDTAGPVDSSSVSHTAMVSVVGFQRQTEIAVLLKPPERPRSFPPFQICTGVNSKWV